MTETKPKTSEVHVIDANALAVERTMMAADRTLMAWTRTALSMIGFGFTVYKFMQAMQAEGKAMAIKDPSGPRNFGLALITLGIISLLLAGVQYWKTATRLNPGGKSHFSLALIVAGFIVALGLFALTNLIFQLGPF
jgi:putative membrane protein